MTSRHAPGLRPRRTAEGLTNTPFLVWPSRNNEWVGIRNMICFRGSIPGLLGSPVNASGRPLPAYPHDSGPQWLVIPFVLDSFIPYHSTALNGASFVPIVVSIVVFAFFPTMIAKATDKGKD